MGGNPTPLAWGTEAQDQHPMIDAERPSLSHTEQKTGGDAANGALRVSLREAEARYRSLVDHLPAIISISANDPQSSTLYISPQVEAILGYTPAEYTADPDFWMETIHPDDLALVLAEIARTNRTGEPFHLEYRRLARDGRVVWVLDEGVLIRDDSQRPLYWQSILLDITARKQTEAALHQSEERFRTAFAHAAIGMDLVDLDGRFIQVNAALCTLTGFSEGELLASTIREITHVDDRDGDGELFQQLVAGELHSYDREKRFVRKDGRIVWARVNAALVRDQAGKPMHVIGQIEDITARKAAEAALAKERELLTAVLETLPDAVYVKDTASRFVRLNAATARQLGLSDPDEAIGETDFAFFLEPLAREFFADEQRLLATGQPMVSKREWQSGPTDERWVLASKVPLRNAQGAIVGLVGINRDITQLHDAEQALRRSEAQFRSLISKATDIITILDADGVIQYESPPITRILGYAADELVGRNAFALIHPDDRAGSWEAFARAIADPSFVPTVELRFRHADGSWRWFEATGTNLLGDPDVSGFVVNSREITDRKIAEQEVRAALDSARAANRATNQFLTMMSHELRTPMQAVLGYAELLLAEDDSSLSDRQIEDIQAIQQGAQRLVALVGEILDLSRLEAGQLELVSEPVDLAEIVRQVRQDVAPQAAAKGLALAIELPPAIPTIHGDAKRLRQILVNLAGNAVKFTDEGAVRITVSETADAVSVAVSDSGIGIAPEELPHIFDEFRQATSGMTRRYTGAGLGLAIARKLAEQHGGSIGVTSQLGAGSTFTLSLPIPGPREASGNGRSATR
jgi:PAS domain S-box-containing protein